MVPTPTHFYQVLTILKKQKRLAPTLGESLTVNSSSLSAYFGYSPLYLLPNNRSRRLQVFYEENALILDCSNQLSAKIALNLKHTNKKRGCPQVDLSTYGTAPNPEHINAYMYKKKHSSQGVNAIYDPHRSYLKAHTIYFFINPNEVFRIVSICS
ncbi:hypothetical protein AB4Z22_09315, partial [Paenibacillus sp. TAF58]